MKKGMKVLLIFCFLIPSFYVPSVHAKTLGDLKTELEEYETEYNENKEQQKLNEQEIASIKNNINSINNKISQASKDIDSLNNEIEELNEQIDINQKEIEEILAFVQIQNGESAYLEYAFGAQDFTDFIYRIAVSEQLTTHNDALIDECNENIETNKNKKEELANKKTELANEQSNLKVEMNKISASLKELDNLSLSIEEQIDAKKSEIKIYEDKGCKIDEDIRTCGKAMLPPDTSFWRPISKGCIAGSMGLFGWRINPVKPYNSDGTPNRSYHYGMDLGTSNGWSGTVPIYSAANGVVVYIPPLSSCGGRKVYIQHNVNGTIYTTGYLHMHSVYVEEGQTVSKDTQIGTMGGFEDYDYCSTGPHLHFEVSTGTISSYSNYKASCFSASNVVNMPSSVNTYWYDRTTRY